ELLCNRYAESVVARLTGQFDGKMIVVNMLMDEIAYPWGAEWYCSKIKDVLGNKFDDNYRLWYIDHAMHVPPVVMKFDTPPVITTRVINYGGVLQQALRDLSAWVEKGVVPPASSTCKIVDAQIEVPPTAKERKGIQPVVNLTVNGGKRADVKVGKKAKFSAVIETPPDTGYIVGAEWDFEGKGDYPVTEKLKDTKNTHVEVKTTYSFSEPGTYFPAIRVTSHRQGDPNTRHARIQNIGRVRVVVTGKGEQKKEPEGKELIFELKEKPDNFQEIVNKFFNAVGQHVTEVQGREIKTNEIGPRTEHSTKFEVVPSAGTTFYSLSFEDTESGIGVFVEIDITVSGPYKMAAKMIKKMTSKSIKENAIETLNNILKENE
ncbi:MAG: PKD domain-containing protein, partial [Promethearchaeota archaeon]